MKKRGTVHGLEEHVANEVIAYLEESNLELKKARYSLSALRKFCDIHYWTGHPCIACGVFHESFEARKEFSHTPCENPDCEEVDSFASCGRFECKPLRCAMCNIALCAQGSCNTRTCKIEGGNKHICRSCRNTLSECDYCDWRYCFLTFHCTDHPGPTTTKYAWKGDVEIHVCTECLEYVEDRYPNMAERPAFFT